MSFDKSNDLYNKIFYMRKEGHTIFQISAILQKNKVTIVKAIEHMVRSGELEPLEISGRNLNSITNLVSQNR
jgi:Fic family protein